MYPEFVTYRQLIINITQTEKKTINWLLKNHFLAGNNEICNSCQKEGKHNVFRLYKQKEDSKNRKKAGLYLQCSGKDHHRISPFNGTFFDGKYCKIPCSKVLELVYHFAWKTPVMKAAREVGVCPNTAIDYYNYCREVCTVSTARRGDSIIGGIGKIVEIDESKFWCRKYNRGRILQGSMTDGWVFGGICRETKEIFMVRVPNRRRDTLYEVIKEHIREGSIIMSDEWAAYATLEQEGYEHHTICHKRNFVDPEDRTVHTQNIECQWRYAKACYPRNSTSNDLRESYLQEYLYRHKHGADNMVHQLLSDIKMLYPFNASAHD